MLVRLRASCPAGAINPHTLQPFPDRLLHALQPLSLNPAPDKAGSHHAKKGSCSRDVITLEHKALQAYVSPCCTA